jgi:hypothetical protein
MLNPHVPFIPKTFIRYNTDTKRRVIENVLILCKPVYLARNVMESEDENPVTK